MVAETEGDLVEGLGEWRDGIENGDMRVDVNSTKVVIGGEQRRVARRALGWPCGVCGGGVELLFNVVCWLPF